MGGDLEMIRARLPSIEVCEHEGAALHAGRQSLVWIPPIDAKLHPNLGLHPRYGVKARDPVEGVKPGDIFWVREPFTTYTDRSQPGNIGLSYGLWLAKKPDHCRTHSRHSVRAHRNDASAMVMARSRTTLVVRAVTHNALYKMSDAEALASGVAEIFTQPKSEAAQRLDRQLGIAEEAFTPEFLGYGMFGGRPQLGLMPSDVFLDHATHLHRDWERTATMTVLEVETHPVNILEFEQTMAGAG